MNGPAVRHRAMPYLLAFFTSVCIMILELVASRLVARHVGVSLNVWTSVIGIMLGGICLGNFLGGRLADRAEPSRVVGPLYALGAALTLGCLWCNALGGLIPESGIPAWLRTVLVVSIDFLIPGTVLGMIGPVVAKIAVEQARRTGSAIGDVYTLGAVGSIVGTFLAGYYLMYLAPTTTIITLVAAALALLAALLMGRGPGFILGLGTTLFLGLGSIPSLVLSLPVPGLVVGGIVLNPIALVGHLLALILAGLALARLVSAREPVASADPIEFQGTEPQPQIRLTDLAALSFVISLAFMAFEMAAGRLASRHLGSSIYGWTSIIGVLLGGLSLGNFLGGKLADWFKNVAQASWLFAAASFLVLLVLLLESPPRWLVANPIEYFFRKGTREPLIPGGSSILSVAVEMTNHTWGVRVFWVIFLAFFLPSIALGTVSPVMAKLAIERVRATKRTGGAIGAIYAWGMVGSILGTFLTGFLLIDILGAKGVILAIATMLALAATVIGTTWHAVWAGIPLGLCIITFVPVPLLRVQGEKWGIREPVGNPDTVKEDDIAYLDESNYYFIKIENSTDPDGQKRTLVLDNLIHGYFILGHPERLDYDYEHLYAMVTDRVARAKAKAKAPTAATPDPAPLETLFLGGGAYAFQRYVLNKYPGSTADVAEIDPAVLRANKAALGLPEDTAIVTHLGDARQYVERNAGTKRFDIVFGDAFNDFSVPWHLTTREFNDKLAGMMAPDGVYMINIIDKYISDAYADTLAEKLAKKSEATRNPLSLAEAKVFEHTKALTYGGFLGSWIKTAKLTFPHIYVFGTDNRPGYGTRETFVVVASKTPLDLETLGGRDVDPKYTEDNKSFEPKAYGPEIMRELEIRSRGIVLTDDYAPVENLLAPVARTRGSNED